MGRLATALKIIGGTGAAAGVGIAGHEVGFRRGASKMSEAMANSFMEQNVIENQAIANKFNAFNEKENSHIAQNYFNRGYILGVNATEKAKKSAAKSTFIKSSSLDLNKISEEAFLNELEKMSGIATGVFRVAKGLGKAVVSKAKSSFKPSALKQSFSNLKKSGKSLYSSAKLKSGKIPGRGNKELASGIASLKKSKAAIATVTGGTVVAGLAAKGVSRKRKQYNYYS